MDPLTALQIGYWIFQAGKAVVDTINSFNEEQQEKDTLTELRELKKQQILADQEYVQNLYDWKIYALNIQLQQTRQSILLEQYERYKQGLADRALAIVTSYSAGISGGARKAQEIAAMLDRDKDINILQRNFLNIAKQLGIEAEIAKMDLQKTLENLSRSYQAVEKAKTLEELEVASRYKTYRSELLSQGFRAGVKAYETWQNI